VDVREDRGGDVFREGGVRSESLHHFFDSNGFRIDPPCVVVGAVNDFVSVRYKQICESSVNSRSANESVAKFMKNERKSASKSRSSVRRVLTHLSSASLASFDSGIALILMISPPQALYMVLSALVEN